MPTTRQIRTRIRTAKNIQQITKAMKMVATARMKKAQDRVQAARPYSEKMRDVMFSLGAAAGSEVSNPLLEVREVNRVGFIVISADRGLCGSYSTNLLKKAAEAVRPYAVDAARILGAGRKGITYFRRRRYAISGEYELNMTGAKFADAQEIGRQARQLYISGEVDAVYLVYTKFLSAMTQRPLSIPLLPLTPEGAAAGDANAATDDYIYEPDAEAILARLLPQYVDVVIYQAMLEAVASEHGSRMTAMSSATDNAGKMISSLTLVLNRARQANITKEIAEIVGGAEAMK